MNAELPPLMPRESQGYATPIQVLDPMSDRFANLWRKLDGGFLRPVWPVALGAGIAGLSLAVSRTFVVAGSITAVLVILVAWFGRSVARRLEDLDRLSD